MNASDDGNNNNNNPGQNNPSENEQRKKGKGRQKITMAKIENETNLQVTFSKRRAGVFKKASELSTLCGAESAVVVFSPGNKPHSFGHPSVETVANRFLQASGSGGGGGPARGNAADQLIMAHNEAAMQQRNQELVGTEAELERERQRKRELDGLGPPPQLDEMDYEQLDQLRKSVVGFKREFEAKVKNNNNNNMGVGSSSSAAAAGGALPLPLPLPPPPVYGYGQGGAGGGYTVQYPPVGGYNNYVDPAAMVQYDPANSGNSDADADANKFQGFGANYRRPGF